MTRLPALKAREVIKALHRARFQEIKQTGSHRFFKHFGSGRVTQVPFHGGVDLKQGTLRSVIEQAGFTEEEFLRLLRKK